MDAGTRRSDPPESTVSVQSFPTATTTESREDPRAVPQASAADRQLAGSGATASRGDNLGHMPPPGFGGVPAAYPNGGFGGVPASAAAIAGLDWQEYGVEVEPRKKRRRRRGDSRGETMAATAMVACTICLVDFVVGDNLNVMPCAHRFHKVCLAKWLALSRLCPCCRYALPSEQDDAARKRAAHQGFGESRASEAPRRSSRARRANVRLFGSEWASSN